MSHSVFLLAGKVHEQQRPGDVEKIILKLYVRGSNENAWIEASRAGFTDDALRMASLVASEHLVEYEMAPDGTGKAISIDGYPISRVRGTPVEQVNINDAMYEELRRQMNEAWMRLDFRTADRLAGLLQLPRPSDHELADVNGGA